MLLLLLVLPSINAPSCHVSACSDPRCWGCCCCYRFAIISPQHTHDARDAKAVIVNFFDFLIDKSAPHQPLYVSYSGDGGQCLWGFNFGRQYHRATRLPGYGVTAITATPTGAVGSYGRTKERALNTQKHTSPLYYHTSQPRWKNDWQTTTPNSPRKELYDREQLSIGGIVFAPAVVVRWNAVLVLCGFRDAVAYWWCCTFCGWFYPPHGTAVRVSVESKTRSH